eukprot:GHVR01023519.1.p1 GENE.GHVR01023519.1~~GHVR01023519.1.p1  ORF type:complete len:103 (+),score=39.22 GHVR01023519.1:49-357(+)
MEQMLIIRISMESSVTSTADVPSALDIRGDSPFIPLGVGEQSDTHTHTHTHKQSLARSPSGRQISEKQMLAFIPLEIRQIILFIYLFLDTHTYSCTIKETLT